MAKGKELSLADAKKASDTMQAILETDTMTAAAKKLGIKRQTLYERVDRFDLRDQIADLRHNALLELLASSTKASRKLIKHMDSEDEKVSLAASNSVLDRTGITKQDNSGTKTEQHFHLHQAEQRQKYNL
jgi:transposase-like protein